MSKEQVFETTWLGRSLIFKTGKLAKQANSAVTVQYGDTVVLATVVESKTERDIGFFPLMVALEEKLYAAGIIKGSRWIKREGRPSDQAVLMGRMIDRSIRPLFDDSSRKDVQVMITILSVDKENNHDIVSLIAASAALSISGVKWNGPIGGIKIGRVDGKFIANPTYEQMKESDLELIVAGTDKKTIMIEAGANEIKEMDIFEAIKLGQKELQPSIDLIKQLQKKCQKTLVTKEKIITEEEKKDAEEKEKIVNLSNEWLDKNINEILFDKSYYTKGERKLAITAIKDNLDKYLYKLDIATKDRKYAINKTVENKVDAEVTKQIIENQRRVDGRALDEIRNLSADIDILPRNHGAGLFSRGETQVMSITTLGAPGLELHTEGLEGNKTKSFMHHYNFPPYSVGEAKPIFGPSRRDIGHGALAEKALSPVIPSKTDFPYTIRIVSETLGSNGSSSMASTCASSLSLMDAGVPIKKAVAGIAMGLSSNADMSKWEVLTDIQDLEDGLGGMDFKIAGTKDGITAIQLDTKTNGITEEIIEKTLIQGNKARLQILDVMNTAISEPKKELSKYAPLIIQMTVNPDKIRDIIGPGGKIINKIIADKDVSIDIDDNGSVIVCGNDKKLVEEAIKTIEELTHEFKAGEIFKGTVSKMFDFGVMVEISRGNSGLVHISELAPYRISKPSNFLKEGDVVTVRVKEIDDKGRVNLSMTGLKENEELWKDKKGMENQGRSFPNNNKNNNGNRTFNKKRY